MGKFLIRKMWCRKQLKGSLTVEAAMVMAMVLVIFMWVMQASIELYQQIAEGAGKGGLDISKAPLLFREKYYLKEFIK